MLANARWPKLKRIDISSAALREDDMNSFLIAHPTLEHIHFWNLARADPPVLTPGILPNLHEAVLQKFLVASIMQATSSKNVSAITIIVPYFSSQLLVLTDQEWDAVQRHPALTSLSCYSGLDWPHRVDFEHPRTPRDWIREAAQRIPQLETINGHKLTDGIPTLCVSNS